MVADASAPLSVLHVDDNPELGSLVKLYLEQGESDLPCTVTTETSPTAALERLRSGSRFDCVVSDYEMPEMNGIDFAQAVREADPDLPVLLFSSTAAGDIAPEVVEVGLTDYLQKGGDPDQYKMLVRRVERAVEGGGRFDAAAEVRLEGVGVLGTDERFQEVDESYAALYGYRPEEVVGKHWSELHPADEVKHIRANVLPVIQRDGQWSGRSKGIRADGTVFAETKFVSALDDGRLLITVSTADDETHP